MAKKKKKSSWKKKLAKAALLGVAGYAAYKGLGKKSPVTGTTLPGTRRGRQSKGMDLSGATNIGGAKWKMPKDPMGNVYPNVPFKGGGRTGKKHGGRTGKQFGGGLNRAVARPVGGGLYRPVGGVGAPVRPMAYKHGGKVKSMGVAKRGGGIAKR